LKIKAYLRDIGCTGNEKQKGAGFRRTLDVQKAFENIRI
jgi:hypothetical protein